MIPTTSLSDMPYNRSENDFGTDRYVNGLINFIKHSSTPITIALQGEWGSGKTSLMNRLKHALCETDGPFIGIEINTWEYSMLSTPQETVLKILERLVNQLSQDDPKPKAKLNGMMKSVGNFLYRGARESLKTIPGVGGMIAVGLEATNTPTQLFDSKEKDSEEEKETEPVLLADLKQALEAAIAQNIADNKRGVIIFVDDLDRLNPPLAVEILELLKNIFCIDNCIFVLAIDYEVVVKGLEPKFGKLTEKNEYEFRSFFDKLIQVPFSLPVSSYKPMNFVIESLHEVGYLSTVEMGDERIVGEIEQIVNVSVGKNPRSIKRLINTLSLLQNIANCGEEQENSFAASMDGRLVNLAVVAIQICYPRIYRMLAMMPDFTKWDVELLQKQNVHVNTNDMENTDWNTVLEKACSTDTYLTSHVNDIRTLLKLIETFTTKNIADEEQNMEELIQTVIDKSSITGVSGGIGTVALDKKRLIHLLHNNVCAQMKAKYPEVAASLETKKNTGNGGFYTADRKVEIIVRPYLKENKVKCEIIIHTNVKRPESLIGKSFDEMVAIPQVKALYEDFDSVVEPLLKSAYYFSGNPYTQPDGRYDYAHSFLREQEYRCQQGWLDNHLCTPDLKYFIELPRQEAFQEDEIINNITELVAAAHRLWKQGQELNLR